GGGALRLDEGVAAGPRAPRPRPGGEGPADQRAHSGRAHGGASAAVEGDDGRAAEGVDAAVPTAARPEGSAGLTPPRSPSGPGNEKKRATNPGRSHLGAEGTMHVWT